MKVVTIRTRAAVQPDSDPLLGFEKCIHDMKALRDREAIRVQRLGRALCDGRDVPVLERRARSILRAKLSSVATRGDWWSLPRALWSTARVYWSLALLALTIKANQGKSQARISLLLDFIDRGEE